MARRCCPAGEGTKPQDEEALKAALLPTDLARLKVERDWLKKSTVVKTHSVRHPGRSNAAQEAAQS